MCLAIVIGMVITKYSIRLVIFSVSIPFFVAAVLALTVKDIGEKIAAKHANQ
jgi:hypothetical protein